MPAKAAALDRFQFFDPLVQLTSFRKTNRPGFLVYGFRSSVHDYAHVEFPGDLRNCETCHVNDSYQLPLPEGLLPTPTPYAFQDMMEPETAACLSCHDSFDAAAHAAANTGALGESCSTCHGEDKAFSVDFIHAR